MEQFINILLILLVLLNFRLLGTSRLIACIQSIAIQALLFGILSFLYNRTDSALVVFSLIIATTIKAGLIPWFIRRTTIRVGARRELEPFVNYAFSLLAGTVLLGISLLITFQLKINLDKGSSFYAPIAFFTIMTGFFLIIARKKAVTQVLGYLALENGIYAFGMSFPLQEPIIIEMGILLDVFAAIFIMGITIYHINREFDHIDIDRISAVRGGGL